MYAIIYINIHGKTEKKLTTNNKQLTLGDWDEGKGTFIYLFLLYYLCII